MYQATSDKPNIQKKTYEALLQALRRETDPCILLGDFNASITGGRWGYARGNKDNPISAADAAFAEFVEQSGGTIMPPDQDTWRNPYRGARGQEAKLDFAITYNIEEEMVEGYVDWISVLHDHARVGYAIGDSLWGTIDSESKPTQQPKPKGLGKRLKLSRMLPFVQEVNEECDQLAASILGDQDLSSREGTITLLQKRQEAFRARLPAQVAPGDIIKLLSHRNAEQRSYERTSDHYRVLWRNHFTEELSL